MGFFLVAADGRADLGGRQRLQAAKRVTDRVPGQVKNPSSAITRG